MPATTETPPAETQALARFSSPETKAKREELVAKRAQMATIFEEAGPTMDMDKVKSHISGDSKAKADEILRRNTELTELAKTTELYQSRDDVSELKKKLDEPLPGFLFPGQSSGSAKSTKFAGKTIGDVFIESETYKQYKRADKRSPSTEIDLGDPREGGVGLKTLLDRTAWSIEPDRLAIIVPGALRRPVVADLIPSGSTNSSSIKYMEETTTTNAAAAVAEGAAKPESALAFTARTATVEKIASVLPVTDELFDDAPAMRSYVEARLRLFLQLAEETALLSGSGTTPQIRGLLNFSGIQTQAKGADPTPTAIYKALTLIRVNAFVEADGVIIHPTDWQDIATLTTADGIYIWGNPSAAMPVERIWGMPVVVTPAITVNTGLVGAFAAVTQLFRRSTVTFAVSDQHSTFFTENKLMLRVEERLALACYRPAGLCTVTGI